MKIFIGPTEIAGIATGLCVGFRKIDVKAELILNQPHQFGYSKFPEQHWLIKLWLRFGALNQRTSRSQIIRKLFFALSYRISNVLVLIWCLQRFDAFIFMFGQTITDTRLELWLMKVLGKRIIFLYLGSDARPAYIDRALVPDESAADLDKLKYCVARSKRRILFQEKYADFCINSPSTAQFHQKPFINWFEIGLPKDVSYYPAHEVNSQAGQKVRVLHSPSNPLVKGTPLLLSVIDRLKGRGYPIELVKIEGMPNSTVLEELAQCDFVVDQLYSDTPMAAFAAEAAHCGKPAVVGGYFAQVMQSYIRKENVPPSLFVHPEEIEKAIEKLIVDVDYRQALGRRAQRFVKNRWAPEEVARRFLRLINGDIPDDWWFDPQDIRYVQGVGLTEELARKRVRSLVERFGKASLQIEDKPELEKEFLKFAGLHKDATKC